MKPGFFIADADPARPHYGQSTIFDNNQSSKSNHMTDILYTLASIGFFALMAIFVIACGKV
ncbi:MAG: hypothetical protein WCH43_07245 [Verrucomicrobiota bacterium]